MSATAPTTFEDLVARFELVRPHSPNDSFNGYLFDASGADLHIVSQQAAKDITCVWTLLDCDGHGYVDSGMHLVNRVGHFIAKIPFVGSMETPLHLYSDTDFDRALERALEQLQQIDAQAMPQASALASRIQSYIKQVEDEALALIDPFGLAEEISKAVEPLALSGDMAAIEIRNALEPFRYVYEPDEETA